MDISRNDLCTQEQISDWKATYPVGGRITIAHHDTGADTVYTVLSVHVDDHATFHPSTNVALFRCSALLRPV
jgi:hypothetical protein